MLIFNIVFASLLLGCYLSAVVSAEKIPLLGLLSLGYTILLFINIGFIVFWGIFLKKYFLISLIVILIRVDYLPLYVQFGKKAGENETTLENSIKIMSFNTHLFLYDNEDKRPQAEKTLELIKEWGPDIICMQEFSSKKSDGLRTLEKIKEQTGKYHYSPRESVTTDATGNVLISRFPIINSGIVDADLKYSYKLMFVDLVANEDTLRVYNMHLASFKLSDEDARALEEWTENHNFEKEKSKTLIKKLIKAQKEHAKEVEVLKKHIAESPYKVIICGDFNDTPASYAYQQLKQDMKDAFTQKGSGFGTTYNGKFPAFRIDYILHNKSYRTVGFKLQKVTYSDHCPILAILQPNKK